MFLLISIISPHLANFREWFWFILWKKYTFDFLVLRMVKIVCIRFCTINKVHAWKPWTSWRAGAGRRRGGPNPGPRTGSGSSGWSPGQLELPRCRLSEPGSNITNIAAVISNTIKTFKSGGYKGFLSGGMIYATDQYLNGEWQSDPEEKIEERTPETGAKACKPTTILKIGTLQAWKKDPLTYDLLIFSS